MANPIRPVFLHYVLILALTLTGCGDSSKRDEPLGSGGTNGSETGGAAAHNGGALGGAAAQGAAGEQGGANAQNAQGGLPGTEDGSGQMGGVAGAAALVPVPASNLVVVSPTGDDAAAGTEDAPLKTLAAARDRVRAMGEAVTGDIHIRLREGTYWLSEALLLDERDSGRGESSIIWEAYGSE
jgi:hypothetical protein